MPTPTAPARSCACGAPITRHDAERCVRCANRRHAFTPETARAAVEARTRRYRDALAAAGLPPPRRARPGAAKRQL